MWGQKKLAGKRKLTGKDTKENKSSSLCQVYSKWQWWINIDKEKNRKETEMSWGYCSVCSLKGETQSYSF